MYKLNTIFLIGLLLFTLLMKHHTNLFYVLIVWERGANKSVRPLDVQPNQIIGKCLNEKDIQ